MNEKRIRQSVKTAKKTPTHNRHSLVQYEWKAGQSGNPGGRPRHSHEVRMAFQEFTQKALDTLVALMDDRNGLIRCRAAETVLARGWGLPQPVEPTEEGNKGEMLADFSRLSNEEWEQFKKLNHKVLVEQEGQPNQLPEHHQKVYRV